MTRVHTRREHRGIDRYTQEEYHVIIEADIKVL